MGDTIGTPFLEVKPPIEGIDYPKQPLPGLPPVNYHQYYGYHDSIHITGAVGMPYAWTGRTNMGNDYCYIGFETTSPYLQDSPPGSWTITDYAYGYFPYYFYEYLLGRDGSVVHHDIADSLDYAARETFGTKQGEYYTYEDSILNIGHWFYTNLEGMEGWWYWRMRVIGYEDGVLP